MFVFMFLQFLKYYNISIKSYMFNIYIYKVLFVYATKFYLNYFLK